MEQVRFDTFAVEPKDLRMAQFLWLSAIASLNLANWQIQSTFLIPNAIMRGNFCRLQVLIKENWKGMGLFEPQTMLIIVVSRVLIALLSTLITATGLNWHVAFTVQNRYS